MELRKEEFVKMKLVDEVSELICRLIHWNCLGNVSFGYFRESNVFHILT